MTPAEPSHAPKVVVSGELPYDVRRWLPPDARVVVPAPGAFAHELSDADALICLLIQRVDEALLAGAPRLGIVANHAVGYDNIDVAAATRRGVLVTNTPDVLTDATADLAFALLLAAARRVVEGDRLARSGTWAGWQPGQLIGADVHGRTLGIVGLGRIGRAVARRARGFDMRVLYASPRRAPDEVETQLGARHVALPELLAGSDFVSLHVPLRDDTRKLIGSAELARMKPGAILISTARGASVDEDALADALDAGRLAGAGLDVYADEPRIPDRLRSSPRTVLLPHLGSATHSARESMARLAAETVAAFLRGERPLNLINDAAWQARSGG